MTPIDVVMYALAFVFACIGLLILFVITKLNEE